MNTIIMSNTKNIANETMLKKLAEVGNSLISITQENIDRALCWAIDNEKPNNYYHKADGSEPNTLYCGDYEENDEYEFDHSEDSFKVQSLRNTKPGIYAVDNHRLSYLGIDIQEFRRANPNCELSDIEIYLERGALGDIAGIGIMDDKIIGLYNSRYFSVNPVIIGKDNLPHICQASCGGVVKSCGTITDSVREYNESYQKQYENSNLDFRRLQILAIALV